MTRQRILSVAVAAAALISAAPAEAGTILFSSWRCESAEDRMRRGARAPIPGVDLGCIPALWSIKDDGRGMHRLSDGPGAEDPAWGSDRTRAVFVASGISGLRLNVWTRAGASPLPLPTAADGVSDRQPDVSPDGRTIAFASNRETDLYRQDIWLVGADGGEPRRLTSSPEADRGPRFTPDGRRIEFTRSTVPEVNRPNDPDAFDERLFSVAVNGGKPTRLTVGGLTSAGGPLLSPDGRHVAFGYQDGLYVMAPDGTGFARPFVRRAYDLTWIGAGPGLVFTGLATAQERDISTALYRIEASKPERGASRLTPPPSISVSNDTGADWSGGPAFRPPPPAPDVSAPAVIVGHPGVVVSASEPPAETTTVSLTGLQFMAYDPGGVRRVDVAIGTRVRGDRCRFWLAPGLTKPRSCERPPLRRVETRAKWAQLLRGLPLGTYRFTFRVADRARHRATREIALRVVT